MSSAQATLNRLRKEFQLLHSQPPPGISVWPATEDNMYSLTAQIRGPPGTVYEKGMWTLEVSVPKRYPFEPPNVRFVTPIFHPNIDTQGRICLDILNMPPKGEWKPALNISTVLTSIQVLIGQPNPEDGLMADITDLFRRNRTEFDRQVEAHIQKHAQELAATSSNGNAAVDAGANRAGSTLSSSSDSGDDTASSDGNDTSSEDQSSSDSGSDSDSDEESHKKKRRLDGADG